MQIPEYKIVVLGGGGVGVCTQYNTIPFANTIIVYTHTHKQKSTLTIRLLTDNFLDEYVLIFATTNSHQSQHKTQNPNRIQPSKINIRNRFVWRKTSQFCWIFWVHIHSHSVIPIHIHILCRHCWARRVYINERSMD